MNTTLSAQGVTKYFTSIAIRTTVEGVRGNQ